MAESDGQDKTEEPTEKRVEKAREDGQLATSKELMVVTTLSTGFALYFAIMFIANGLLEEWRGFFKFDSAILLQDEVVRQSSRALGFVIINGLLFSFPILLIILATQAALSGGLNFAPSAMMFKASRINPLAGLKRMFSSKAIFELGKSVLKVGLLLSVSFFAIQAQIGTLIEAQSASLGNGMSRLEDAFILLLGALIIVLALIALIDVLWQINDYKNKLKMTRQEIKDEHKQTEGSPEVKAKIRRLQMKVATSARAARDALEQVPEATAIITNPTHFAIALKYEVGTRGAPIILAMGRGNLAEEIKKRGRAANITIFESPLLARALFFGGELGREIPEALYTAVAAILAFIYRLEAGDEVDPPDLDIPDDLQFDEEGKLIHGD